MTQFDDVLIYTHGRHIIKTGYQMNRYNLNVFYSGNAGELGSILYGTASVVTIQGTALAVIRLLIGPWVFRRLQAGAQAPENGISATGSSPALLKTTGAFRTP